ncbi:hypothetical protein MICRO8M_30122 [Microbacterium sp. 8M]|nr:hypothetical protein MICRO8M_30122 [Microbacterium sp. 8M]
MTRRVDPAHLSSRNPHRWAREARSPPTETDPDDDDDPAARRPAPHVPTTPLDRGDRRGHRARAHRCGGVRRDHVRGCEQRDPPLVHRRSDRPEAEHGRIEHPDHGAGQPRGCERQAVPAGDLRPDPRGGRVGRRVQHQRADAHPHPRERRQGRGHLDPARRLRGLPGCAGRRREGQDQGGVRRCHERVAARALRQGCAGGGRVSAGADGRSAEHDQDGVGIPRRGADRSFRRGDDGRVLRGGRGGAADHGVLEPRDRRHVLGRRLPRRRAAAERSAVDGVRAAASRHHVERFRADGSGSDASSAGVHRVAGGEAQAGVDVHRLRQAAEAHRCGEEGCRHGRRSGSAVVRSAGAESGRRQHLVRDAADRSLRHGRRSGREHRRRGCDPRAGARSAEPADGDADCFSDAVGFRIRFAVFGFWVFRVVRFNAGAAPGLHGFVDAAAVGECPLRELSPPAP